MGAGLRWIVRIAYGLAVLLVVVLAYLAYQGTRLDQRLTPVQTVVETIFIGDKADHLLDHGDIGIIDAGTLPGILARMKASEGRAPGVGLRYYEGAKLWLSMVVPRLAADQDRWVLKLDNTRVREARLAVVDQGVVSEHVWTYDSPERRLGLSTRTPAFEFDRSEIEGKRILLGFNSLGAMRAAVYLETARAWRAGELWQALKYGLLIGFLMALAIYLAVIGTRIGERSLVFAAGLCFFAGLFISGVGGYFHTVALAGSPHVADALLYGTQPVMMSFWMMLVVAYLDLPVRAPRMSGALILVAVALPLQGILTVATNLGYPIPFITDNGTPVLIGIVAGLSPLVWYSLKGDRRARRLLACFTPIVISTSIRLFLYLSPSSQPHWVAWFEGFVDVVATMALLAIVIVLDIQRREASLRREAKRNELRFRDYAEITADAVFEVGPDGLIRASAGPLSRTLGLAAGQSFGEGLPSLSPSVMEALRAQPRRALEFSIPGDGGGERWASLSSVPIADEDGKPDGFRAVVSDITANVAERENETRRNTLAALGHLAGGIAHEVNNLLHPIINLSRRVADRHVGDPDGKRLLELVVASGIRAGEIVRSVLRAYSPESFAGPAVSLDVAVRDAIDTVRATLPSTCSVEVEIALNGTLRIRVGEMIQVLSNLANNAIRAMDGIGTLSIRLAEEASGPVLTVADNGSGMPEAIRKRAMEPFATGSPGGVGLGLSIVRRIVSAWHADIEILSEEPRGTAVRICFRRSEA
jgi:signal transduction histidine kinase